MKTQKNDWKAVALNQAEILTENWQRQNELKAFLFHPNEISCIRNEVDCEKIRFYIGLNGNNIEMIAVGVNSSGNDIIGTDGNSQIYNFAMPCPSTCDILSPLYHGNVIESDPVKFRTFPSGVNCVERLQQISTEEAFTWTLKWQKDHEIKSFLFELEQLALAIDLTDATSVRIYFGLETNSDNIYTILTGVDEKGKDKVTNILQINQVSPCSKSILFKNSCDEQSPLYHRL